MCEKMTSSTKPEVHNALHGRQRRTELRPHSTLTENLVKFGPVVFEIYQQTDRQTKTDKQTGRHSHRNTSHPFTCLLQHIESSDMLFVTKIICK